MMSMSVTMHPIWEAGTIILGAVVLIALLLQVLVQRLLPATLRQQHIALGGAIFAVIGTTYAVLLAFMATTAWEQYSAAQDLARHEADLIGSIYHASRGLPEPAGQSIRADLTAYLTRIIEVEWPAQITGRRLPADESLLTDLDRIVLSAIPANTRETVVEDFLIRALNDVETARRDRRLASAGSIPDLVWMVLLSGGALVVGFNFMLGGPALGLHMLMTAALVASGVLVLLLIVGLSSPFHGSVTISPSAYVEVLAEMQATR
jgi:hypothetical protein